MYKKILLTLTLALGLALTSALALAQMPLTGSVVPQEMLQAWADEKPLTQADIDAYIKLLPSTGAVASDTAAVAKLYEGAGFSEARFGFVASKIGLSMGLAAGATAQQLGLDQVPAVLRPSEADIELVKKNADNLQKATMEMIANMQGAK